MNTFILCMLLFLDIETTGFDNTKDHILEVSAVRFDGKTEVARFDRLVTLDPEIKIPTFITHLTGINNEMGEKEGVSWEQLQQELEAFLEPDDVITGHNISFDTGFLKAKGVAITHQEIDTFMISILVLGRTEESHSLEMLSQKYGLVHENAHRALSDVLANAELYWLLETAWAKRYDSKLDKFLQEYASKITFPELMFFDSVRANIDSLSSQSFPASGFPDEPVFWEQSECFDDVVQEMGQNLVFWETSFPERNMKDLVHNAEQQSHKTVFLYPSDKSQKYLELYESLQNPSVSFISDGKTAIDSDRWEEFLCQSSFSREESIVLVKIWNAKHRNEEVFLKFLNEEWPVVRGLCSPQYIDSATFPTVTFLPFHLWESVNDDVQVVVLEGDALEDMVTETSTQKLFTKRFSEDHSHAPEWEALSFALQNISALLRQEKGENKYTLPVPFSQAVEISGFTELWAAAGGAAFGEWNAFFDEENDKNLFLLIELFPDNEMAFSLKPVDVSALVQPLLEKNPLVMGKSFPRFRGDVHFSFELPLSTKEFFEELPTIEHFELPDVSRTLSAKEFAVQVVAEMHNGKNSMVSVNSKKVLDEVMPIIREGAEKNGYTVLAQGAGSIGKLRTQILLAQDRNEKLCLVATPRYLDILCAENFAFHVLMVAKPMFDPPKQPFVSARRGLYRSDFEEFSLPRALMRFRREVRRFSHIDTLFLGDGRVHQENSWARVFWREVE